MAFPHLCPPPQALFHFRHPRRGLVNAPWSSHSLEVAGPSTWRWPPVEGETTSRTWTATWVEERCYSFSWCDGKVETNECTPYFVPYPWCCIFIDQKRTEPEITQSQKDVKSWTYNRSRFKMFDPKSHPNIIKLFYVILVKGEEIKWREHVTPHALSSNVTATNGSLLVARRSLWLASLVLKHASKPTCLTWPLAELSHLLLCLVLFL